MPGYGFTLPVKVGGQVDLVCIAGKLFQLGHYLFLAWQDFIVGLPAIIGVDPHAANQQLARLLLAVACFLCRRHGL